MVSKKEKYNRLLDGFMENPSFDKILEMNTYAESLTADERQSFREQYWENKTDEDWARWNECRVKQIENGVK